MPECPDPETFERLFSGELDSDQRAAIADHAASCRDCHQLVDLLLDSGTLATTGGVKAATALDFSLRTGATIDRYVIDRRIGQGGMGVVYAARDPELGRGVAIKVLRAGAPADRLRREAQALAKLSHPNVVAVHDVGDHDGQTFIAMALVDGVTLRVWLEQPREVKATLDVLRAAGRGIAAAHAAGMIHRDLKPDNIFIAHDGGVLVGDFGLARDVETDDDELHESDEMPIAMTATGMILGTPAYMAPEQAKGEATAASDQFAFCVTAWEALYGARPFPGATFATLQAAIAAGTITKPTDDRAVPAKIDRAFRRGLAADPAERFGSMAALLHELEPRRRRWPWLVGVVPIVIAFAMRGHAAEPCATEHLLDGVWTQHEATPTGAALDAYAKRWLTARHEVCATRDELGAAVADARTRCLDQDRVTFGVVIDAIATAPDPLSALHAIDQLPPIDACAHAAIATRTPAELTIATSLAMRVAYVEARFNLFQTVSTDQLDALVADAERLGDDGMLVRASLLEADGFSQSGQPALAEPWLRRALLAAERSRDDRARVSTRIELGFILMNLQRLVEARNVLDEAATVLARFGGDHDQGFELVRANAMLASAEGNHKKAIELLHQYVAAREQDHEIPKLAMGYIHLAGEAGWIGDAAEAAAAYRKLSQLEAALGIEHADTMAIESEASAVQALGQFTRAIELEQQAYALMVASSHSVIDEVRVLFNVAAAYELANDSPNMLVYNEKELALMPEEPAIERAGVMENIGVAHSRMGHAAPAIEWLTKALALYTKIGKPADPQNAKIALATAYVQAGRLHDARVLCEQLLPEVIATDPPRPWRSATVEWSLARSLWEEGDAHERAHALVIAADAERDFGDGIAQLSKFPMANGSVTILQGRLADLRAWRAKHPG